MRVVFLILVAAMLATSSFGQLDKRDEIVKEGTILYKTEMASWYGTDIFLEKFSAKRASTGGYFSYVEDDRSICLFFSSESKPKVLASFSFDSTYNIQTAVVNSQEREFSAKEYDLFVIRQIALSEVKIDTLFKHYRDMNLNLIPLNDEKGKRVYILTGPQKQGVVVFGNDYLLTFDGQNKLTEKKRLHKNINSIESNLQGKNQAVATIHSHVAETGDLITATDICTLKLYARYTTWQQHYVLSQRNVSIWDCKKESLVVMTRDAWDKIGEHQKTRRKR